MDKKDQSKISRRAFIQSAGVGLIASAGTSIATASEKKPDNKLQTLVEDRRACVQRLLTKAPLPKAKGQRMLVVGAGWSGLTMAKYLKIYNPDLDVVLIDKRTEFISFPASNPWLADQVSLNFLTHSFIDAALSNDYHFFNASVLDIDRTAKKVYTEKGYIDYHYLVLAPGIEYDYQRIGVEDPVEQLMLYQQYPGGFVDSSELISIKRKLHTFKGGTFILTVPSGDYRCTAAPYERACMVAALFKKRGIRAKVLLLDMNTGIKIKKHGFEQAFSKLYSDMIQYLPSSEISSVDLSEKTISTEFDDYTFDDAIIYPPVRASKLIEHAGIANLHNAQKVANTDPFKYHAIGDEYVYVTGDSRSQPFSKGGHTAHSEAQYVAELIAAHSKGKQIPWRSPQTMCFSAVNIDPLEAMSIITYYKYGKKSKQFAFDRTHMIEKWDRSGGQASLAWAEGMYRDMFYK